MHRFQFHLILTLLICAGGGTAARAGNPTTHPASPALQDSSGHICRPLEIGSGKAAVILFIDQDCPICNSYAPEINRLCKSYQPLGIGFYLVHTDPAISVDDAKKHATEYGFTCPVLFDRTHELVRQLGVTVTPEAAIIGPGGELLYRGRIDDLYADLGKRRYQATTHDLRDALDAIIAGKPVPPPGGMAVGCAIAR